MNNTKKRIYEGVVWRNGPDKPGERVSLVAENSCEAIQLMKEKYGEDVVYTIGNQEDGDKPRRA